MAISLASWPVPPSPAEATAIYRAEFARLVEDGRIVPALVPYCFYGYLLCGVYLLIPHTHRPWLYAMRWPVFAAATWWNLRMLREISSLSPGGAFATGLVCMWGIPWAAKFLLLERVQWDWRRIMERKGWKRAGDVATTRYYWQSYPTDNFRDRWDWIADCLLSCRHAGWNKAIVQLPGPPPEVLARLGEPITKESHEDVSYVGSRRHRTVAALRRYILTKLVLEYLVYDFLLTQMRRDHYFTIGPSSHPAPAHLQAIPPRLLRIYRQSLAGVSLILALDMLFSCSPLLFSVLPQSLPGLFRPDLRSQTWLYPDQWGSLRQILDRGLAGTWSGFWHQTFQHVFTSPTQYLVRRGVLRRGTRPTKLIGAGIAFALSGLIHAGGSMTLFPTTQPLHALAFFLLQVVGIMMQDAFCRRYQTGILRACGPRGAPLRRLGNLVYCLVWAHLTADWLLDDFARGGIWLIEPWPVSLWGALGLGGNNRCAWDCWAGSRPRWYRGTHWWQSGLLL